MIQEDRQHLFFLTSASNLSPTFSKLSKSAFSASSTNSSLTPLLDLALTTLKIPPNS